ncbi:hypothetical protein DYH09_23715, partial [bacterium CPR1]|nr:hypothetical protein [bacterium CPR1]
MTMVGVRELKNRLSYYLRLVRGGETLIVTDRGAIVAELKPPQQANPEGFPYPGLLKLAQEGQVRLGTGNDPALTPRQANGAKRTHSAAAFDSSSTEPRLFAHGPPRT